MGANRELFIQLQDELVNSIHRAEKGEQTYIDTLIDLRVSKKSLEDSLAIIKEFEDDNINEIANEASQYPEGYKGYNVSVTNGRKMFSYKGISEIENKIGEVKQLEKKYQAAYEGVQKGIVQISDGGWIDENGEIMPFPEVNFGKSYLTLKETKKKWK